MLGLVYRQIEFVSSSSIYLCPLSDPRRLFLDFKRTLLEALREDFDDSLVLPKVVAPIGSQGTLLTYSRLLSQLDFALFRSSNQGSHRPSKAEAT